MSARNGLAAIQPRDTPRTDALYADRARQIIDGRDRDKEVWNLARTLERELAAKDAEIARLEAVLSDYVNQTTRYLT